MGSNIDSYITDIESEVVQLQLRLDKLNAKLIKWGSETEIKMLQFLIEKKKKLLVETKEYKSNLFSYKD